MCVRGYVRERVIEKERERERERVRRGGVGVVKGMGLCVVELLKISELSSF